MKKLNLLLILALMASLVACSTNSSDSKDNLEEDIDAVEIAGEGEFGPDGESENGIDDEMDGMEIRDEEDEDGEIQAEADIDEVDDVSQNNQIGTGSYDYYHVQKGDTLMLIAFKIYGDYLKWRQIASLNQDQLGGSNNVSQDMKIKYERANVPFNWQPDGNPYLIMRGDTLGIIATKVYNAKKYWKAIWDNNRPMIKDPSLIFAGFTLYYLPLRDLASFE